MNIRARMLCHEVHKGPSYEKVFLQPVYSDNPESPNYSWSKASPSGKFEMMITNSGAFGAFVPGVEYDLLFSPVPKPVVPTA